MTNSEYVLGNAVLDCSRFICQRTTKLWRPCNIYVLYELHKSSVYI